MLLRFSAIKYVIVTSSEVWDSWARRLQLLRGDGADASAGTGEILARCGSVLGRSRCRRPGGRWTAAPRGLRREGAAGWGQRILVRNHSSLVRIQTDYRGILAEQLGVCSCPELPEMAVVAAGRRAGLPPAWRAEGGLQEGQTGQAEEVEHRNQN